MWNILTAQFEKKSTTRLKAVGYFLKNKKDVTKKLADK